MESVLARLLAEGMHTCLPCLGLSPHSHMSRKVPRASPGTARSLALLLGSQGPSRFSGHCPIPRASPRALALHLPCCPTDNPQVGVSPYGRPTPGQALEDDVLGAGVCQGPSRFSGHCPIPRASPWALRYSQYMLATPAVVDPHATAVSPRLWGKAHVHACFPSLCQCMHACIAGKVKPLWFLDCAQA